MGRMRKKETPTKNAKKNPTKNPTKNPKKKLEMTMEPEEDNRQTLMKNTAVDHNMCLPTQDGVVPERSTDMSHLLFGDSLPPNHVSRPTVPQKVDMKVYHGGKITFEPALTYVGGSIEIQKGWDIDEISSIEVGKIVKSCGYASFKSLWYRPPHLKTGLKPLNCDEDVRVLCQDVKGHNLVSVYVEHAREPVVLANNENESDEDVEIVQRLEVSGKGKEKVVEVGSAPVNVKVADCGSGAVSLNDQDLGVSSSEAVNDKVVEVEGTSSALVKEKVGECGSVAVSLPNKAVNDKQNSASVNEKVVEVGGTSSDDESYIPGSEESEGESDDVSVDDSDYGENWDWAEVLPTDSLIDIPLPPFDDSFDVGNGSRNEEFTRLSDFEDEDGDSSDLDSPSDDEEERRSNRLPRFKAVEDGEEVKFKVGQTFSSKELFKQAVKDFAVQQKKDLKFKKDDKKRCVVICVEGCPFYLRISKTESRSYWLLVSFESDHTCCRSASNRQAKTKYLARKFMPIIRHTPNIKVNALIEEARLRWGILLGKWKAYRAKVKAVEMIQGATLDQYTHLRKYAAELLRSNPGSTVIIKSTEGPKGPVFERIYVCFAATKTAFATTCRPLIGLDGCFLKGMYGGQLLAAVGKDGNNQMFPIAFAVVEAETKDSWSWFVELLVNDLDMVERRRWAFISDQQKGLVPTLAELVGDVDHRLCIKHLYGNFRKKYPGAEMKQALWRAARASTLPEWFAAMEVMKGLNEAAFVEMMNLPPKMWTRSAYSVDTQCDLQVNNMCEAFNRAILEYRDKPIITLLEGLKFYMNNRIVKQKQLMLRWRTTLCPMIQQKLELAKKESDKWFANWIGDDAMSVFEVSRDTEKYSVNLETRSCACRRWDLSGIPCAHAVACMWYGRRVPEDFVDSCYRKTTFLQTYSHLIQPNNGPKLWAEVPTPPLNPPYMRRAPGRPKKARRKNNDEPKDKKRLRKHNSTVRCRRCGEYGHNKRTCMGKTAADREIPVGGNKENTQLLHPEQREANQAGPSSSEEPQSQATSQGQPPLSQSQPPTQPTQGETQTAGPSSSQIPGSQATSQGKPPLSQSQPPTQPSKEKTQTAGNRGRKKRKIG